MCYRKISISKGIAYADTSDAIRQLHLTIADSADSGEWEGVEAFDFAWLEKVGPDEEADPVYINLRPGSGLIRHSHPPVDRCCKFAPKGFTYNGIDEVSSTFLWCIKWAIFQDWLASSPFGTIHVKLPMKTHLWQFPLA